MESTVVIWLVQKAVKISDESDIMPRGRGRGKRGGGRGSSRSPSLVLDDDRVVRQGESLSGMTDMTSFGGSDCATCSSTRSSLSDLSSVC